LELKGLDRHGWSISPDFRRVVWHSGGALQIIADDGKKFGIDLKKSEPVAFGILADGAIAAAFGDGSIGLWSATGAPVQLFRSAQKSVDQALVEVGNVALASRESGTVMLYRYAEGSWQLEQRASAPDDEFHLVLPSPGMVAEIAGGAVRVGDETRNTPGATRSAAAELLDVIVAGDFDGVFVLPPRRESYRLADAVPGSIVAASHKKIAVSGPNGTSIFALSAQNHLTAKGRKMAWLAFCVLLAAMLTAFSGLLLELFTRMFADKKKKFKNARIRLSLGEPPPQLVKAVASDDCVLWAGSGLGAQAGYPARQSFAARALQAAADEEWMDPGPARKLKSMVAQGKTEEALHALANSGTELRARLVEFLKSTYARFAVPSRTHELILKLRFPAAITTNYDLLLEQMRDAWMDHTLTLGDLRPAKQFVVKLYGDLHKPNIAMNIAQGLETRTMFFIGCSVDGLIADLAMFNVGMTPTRTHYAIAGVSGLDWKAQSEFLAKRYGIELLVCNEETIGAELPAFLEKLAAEVEQLNRGVLAVSIVG
jgi:hypothetical protein